MTNIHKYNICIQIRMSLHWIPMTYIDTDITAVWIKMPTTTERAESVNANEIFSDMLPSSLIQLQLAVILNAHAGRGKI